MNRLQAGIPWLDSLLPEGMAVPSSTVISGPGGTGKPLVEFAFVAAWLRAGGSLEKAASLIEIKPPGILVFGSALNLLLFSKRYKNAILEKLKDRIANDKSRSYLMAASTTAFASEIGQLEDKADNLMFTRMEPPMRLFLRITRMKDVSFSDKETEVPIPEEMLVEISRTAEATRKRRIKEIRDLS